MKGKGEEMEDEKGMGKRAGKRFQRERKEEKESGEWREKNEQRGGSTPG